MERFLKKWIAAKAADASIGFKDVVPVRDKEIAALQERLATNGAKDTKAAQHSKYFRSWANFCQYDAKKCFQCIA